MKTVSIDLFDKAKHVTYVFFKSSKDLSGMSSNNDKLYRGTNKTLTEDRQFERKAYIGNFFAGPHCLFNPALADK